MVSDERFEGGDAALDGPQHLAGDLDGDVLHVIEVAAVVHADLDEHGEIPFGQVVVRDHGLGQLGVGHEHEVVGQHADRRGSPADIRHVALLAAVESHVVSQADLSRRDHVQPREQVRQRVLQRERDRQPADAEGREQGRDRDAQAVQHHQEAQPDDGPSQDEAGETGQRQRPAVSKNPMRASGTRWRTRAGTSINW